MSDYTPTTDDVEDAWCSRFDSEYHWAVGEELQGYRAEFDRWMEQVKAKAWEEGKRAGLRQSDWEHADPTTLYVAVNPYRQTRETEA